MKRKWQVWLPDGCRRSKTVRAKSAKKAADKFLERTGGFYYDGMRIAVQERREQAGFSTQLPPSLQVFIVKMLRERDR